MQDLNRGLTSKVGRVAYIDPQMRTLSSKLINTVLIKIFGRGGVIKSTRVTETWHTDYTIFYVAEYEYDVRFRFENRICRFSDFRCSGGH